MHVQTQQDLYLATEICVAEKDGRECPWYAVYSRVLWDYIFWDGGGGQHLYTILPQYSLVATFDTGHSTETNRLAGGITAEDQAVTPQNLSHQPNHQLLSRVAEHDVGIGPPTTPKNITVTDFPRTPGYHGPKGIPGSDSPLTPISSGESVPFSGPRYLPGPTSPTPAGRKSAGDPKTVRQSERISRQKPASYDQPTPSTTDPVTPQRVSNNTWKSTRVPDFVVALRKLPNISTFPMIFNNEIHITSRTILIVEIKPDNQRNSWQRLWYSQVRAQAQHAFAADDKLEYLGIIMAVGRHWVYAVAPRLPPETQTDSERRDKTYIPSPDRPSQLRVDGAFIELFTQPTPPDLDPLELYTTPFDKCNPRTITTTGELCFEESHLLDSKREFQKRLEAVLQDLRERNQDMWQ